MMGQLDTMTRVSMGTIGAGLLLIACSGTDGESKRSTASAVDSLDGGMIADGSSGTTEAGTTDAGSSVSGSLGAACSTSSDCTFGLSCAGGACVACAADSDCSSGTCQGGVCTDTGSSTGGCAVDTDCFAGSTCHSGVCTAGSGTCNADPDAGAGGTCGGEVSCVRSKIDWTWDVARTQSVARAGGGYNIVCIVGCQCTPTWENPASCPNGTCAGGMRTMGYLEGQFSFPCNSSWSAVCEVGAPVACNGMALDSDEAYRFNNVCNTVCKKGGLKKTTC